MVRNHTERSFHSLVFFFLTPGSVEKKREKTQKADLVRPQLSLLAAGAVEGVGASGKNFNDRATRNCPRQVHCKENCSVKLTLVDSGRRTRVGEDLLKKYEKYEMPV